MNLYFPILYILNIIINQCSVVKYEEIRNTINIAANSFT